MKGSLNATMDELNRQNKTLEALVTAMHAELNELKGELVRVKRTHAMEASVVILGSRLDIPKPIMFKGSRVAKDVDNFVEHEDFYLKYAEDELRAKHLMNTFSNLMLRIPSMNDKEDLNKAMATAESLVEFRPKKSDSKAKGKGSGGGDKPYKSYKGKAKKSTPKDKVE
ncbi:hypothetical protein CRG98_047493 [Punica granatum]|uniref:Uncharacterized protein n=1 Tax=Punica granatum TaxID=22663 RepID=A0A2I0HK58_PUNGR|nr:hypothetical protein CRG98_047493 [Punica granatum]